MKGMRRRTGSHRLFKPEIAYPKICVSRNFFVLLNSIVEIQVPIRGSSSPYEVFVFFAKLDLDLLRMCCIPSFNDALYQRCIDIGLNPCSLLKNILRSKLLQIRHQFMTNDMSNRVSISFRTTFWYLVETAQIFLASRWFICKDEISN